MPLQYMKLKGKPEKDQSSTTCLTTQLVPLLRVHQHSVAGAGGHTNTAGPEAAACRRAHALFSCTSKEDQL